MDDRLNLFFTLTKVDEARRLVYGRATQEVPDGVREIMDYERSKPYFEQWSKAAEKRSGGKSKGNVREMHEAIAAGKIVEMQFNDAEKAIDIGTYCSNDSTWAKVLDGTLTGFSVGGKYVERFPDNTNPSFMRYVAQPNEISYVDSPAVPTAVYTLIKADGTEEMRKAQAPAATFTTQSGNFYTEADFAKLAEEAEQPRPDPWLEVQQDPAALPALQSEPAESGNAIEDIPVVAGMPLPQPAKPEGIDPILIKQFTDFAAKFSEAVEKLAELRKADAEEKAKLEEKLKAVGARVGIARREGEPLNAPKDYPSDPEEYGDPANWSYPVDKPRFVAAIGRFNGKGGKPKYSPSEWHALGRRIARLASRFGTEYTYSPTDLQITRKEEAKKMSNDMQKVDANAVLAQLSAAMKEAADLIGKDPQAAQGLLMAALGGLQGADATATAAPSLTEGVEEVKAFPATETTPTTPTATVTPPVPEKSVTVVTAPSSGSSPSAEAETPEFTSGPYKELCDKVATLTAMVEKLTAVPAPVAKADLPSQIAALAGSAPKDEENEIVKALREGGPNAFKKAMAAAGGNEGELYKAINDAVVRGFVSGGVITAQRYKVLDITEE